MLDHAVPSGQTRQADTLQAEGSRLWGRGATLGRRAGGGVPSPRHLSGLNYTGTRRSLPGNSAFHPKDIAGREQFQRQ